MNKQDRPSGKERPKQGEKGGASALRREPPAPAVAVTPRLDPAAAAAAMARLFDERELCIDAHHRIQRFFLALDRRTDPHTAAADLRQPMKRLMRVLDARQAYRVYFASRAQPEGIDLFLPSEADLAIARLVSAIFRESACALEGHPWRLAPLAFELFVSGRLVTAHPEADLQAKLCMHGAPDGWNFFLFTELAFVCAEAGIDRDFWDPLLPTLVGASDLLARSGRGELKPRQPSEVSSARLAQWDGRVLPMTAVEDMRHRCAARLQGRAGLDRIRRLGDLFAHALGAAGFMRYSSVFAAPGTRRALLEPQALGEEQAGAQP
jgi:hypothetical protein